MYQQAHREIAFDVSQSQSHFCQIRVTVPATLVNIIYDETARAQQYKTSTHGFGKGATPLHYIKQNYHATLLEQTKTFIFNYFVLNFLMHNIRERKIVIIGDPRLKDVQIERDLPAHFTFECTVPDSVTINAWKHLPFKAPMRKKYHDIDRQVDSFIKEEIELYKNHGENIVAQVGDIVCFDIWLVDENHEPVLKNFKENLWIKLGSEEADNPYHELFVGKQVGDSFFSDHHCLQHYFNNGLDMRAKFGITMIEIVPHAFFSFDSFKQHFRIKTNKEMHRKLIEVFSFRNDVCQRRLMAEEALTLMLKHHHIVVPSHALLRQKDIILDRLKENPDYPVYKMERNFHDKIEQLALKQLKEAILIDHMGYHENIAINCEDIGHYFNFTKRARMKEFIYFRIPVSKIDGQEYPVPTQLIAHHCMREKTLNHIIYYLTQK